MRQQNSQIGLRRRAARLLGHDYRMDLRGVLDKASAHPGLKGKEGGGNCVTAILALGGIARSCAAKTANFNDGLHGQPALLCSYPDGTLQCCQAFKKRGVA